MRTIASQDELDSISGPVLCKFTASWCAPCQAMHPLLEQLGAEFTDTCTFLLINVDNAEALCAAHKVRQIPYVKIIHEGTEHMASVNPSHEKIREQLQSVCQN